MSKPLTVDPNGVSRGQLPLGSTTGQIKSISRAQSGDVIVSGDYFLVPRISGVEDKPANKSQPDDEKVSNVVSSTSSVKVPRLLSTMRTGSGISFNAGSANYRRSGKNGSPSLRVTMVEYYQVNTVTSTSYSSVYALQPKNVADWSSIAPIFDTCQCKGVQIHTSVSLNANIATPVGSMVWALGFDPGTNTGVSGIQDALSHVYHMGPFPVAQSAQHGENGRYHRFTAKTCENFESGLTADLVGGNKFPVTSSVGAIVGYIAPYFNTAATSTTFSLNYIIKYDLEFSYRH
jgi:hypothetical protein